MENVIKLNTDFIKGVNAAKSEVANGEVYDIEGALMLFAHDPADTDFQRGYQQGLIQCRRKGA